MVCSWLNHFTKPSLLKACIYCLISTPLDSPGLNLKDLLNELAGVTSKYYEIGIQLDIKDEILKQIESNHKNNIKRCFSEMLDYWLKGNSGDASWSSLVSALESPFVGEKTLAATLRKKYITSSEITSTLTLGTVKILY